MSRLAGLLRAAGGEISLFPALGRWMQAVATEIDAVIASGASGVRTLGGISNYTAAGLVLTGPFTLDAWFNLDPAVFTAGDLSSDLALSGSRSLVYSGAAKLLQVSTGVSVLATGGAVREEYELGIFRNGSLLPRSSSSSQSTVAQAAVFNAGHVTSQISIILQPGDVLDIRLRERGVGDTPTLLASAYLVISE